MSRKLGELLVARQLLTADELEAALRRQFQEGHRLGSMLVASGRLRLDVLSELLQAQLSVRAVAPAELADGATRCRNLLSLEQIQRYQALPVRTEPGKAHVAFCTPQDAGLVSALAQELGVQIVPTLVPQILLVEAAYRLYGLELAGPRAPGTSPRPSTPAAAPKPPAEPPQSPDDIVAARAALFGGPGVPTEARPPSSPMPSVAAPSRPMPLPPPIQAQAKPNQPPVLTPAGALAAAARVAGPALTPPSVPALTPLSMPVLRPTSSPQMPAPQVLTPVLTPSQPMATAPRAPVAAPPTVAVNIPAPRPSLSPPALTPRAPVNALRPPPVAPIPLTSMAQVSPPPPAPAPPSAPEDDWTRGSGLAALLSRPISSPGVPTPAPPPRGPTPLPVVPTPIALTNPVSAPPPADVDVDVELAEPEEIVQAEEIEPDVVVEAQPPEPIAAQPVAPAEGDADMVVVVDLDERTDDAPPIAPPPDPSSSKTLLVTQAIDLTPVVAIEAKPPEPESVIEAKPPEPSSASTIIVAKALEKPRIEIELPPLPDIAPPPAPITEAEPPEPVVEEAVPEPDIEVDEIEPVAEAAPAETIVEAKSPEPVAETKPVEAIVEAPAPDPVVEPKPPEPVIEAKPAETSVEAQPPEPVVEAPAPDPVVEAKPPEPVVEAKPAETSVEAQPPEPVVEAPAPEPVVEAKPAETIIEAPVPEPVVEAKPVVVSVEAPAAEPLVEAKPEPVVEAKPAEPVVEAMPPPAPVKPARQPLGIVLELPDVPDAPLELLPAAADVHSSFIPTPREVAPDASLKLTSHGIREFEFEGESESLELAAEVARASAPIASPVVAETSMLAQFVDDANRQLGDVADAAALIRVLTAFIDSVAERGAVLERRDGQLVPVCITGAGVEPNDPALCIPLDAPSSFKAALDLGRAWRGELNEPAEWGFASRLGPTTRSVIIPVGGNGARWFAWGVIPELLTPNEAEHAHFDRLGEAASVAAAKLG